MSKYSKKREKMQVKTCPCENRDGVAGGQRRVCLPGGEVIINAQAELLETACSRLSGDMCLVCGKAKRRQGHTFYCSGCES